VKLSLNSSLSGIPASNPENVKVLILGSGPAGWSAALYAARAELKPLILTGSNLGGQAALTFTIENYPGFPEGIGGMELGELFQKQAEKFGARTEFGLATAADLSKRPFSITTEGNQYLADALIIATGASPNKLGILGEKELTGKGVSYCATCDGFFFKNKKVAVIGGGDSALEEALFLTRFASSITIIHRRDNFRAGAILRHRVKEEKKIELMLDTIPLEITGKEKVEGIKLKNVKTEKIELVEFDGVFIFIGHTPNVDLFIGQLALDEHGYLLTDNRMQTSIPGVFTAGEVADPHYRQVITSAGMGAAAAIQVTRFLQEH
jgi:thioredoxin reductase (NADPH)